MLKKAYSKKGTSCRVTFKVPAEVAETEVAVLGDWNDWSEETNPLVKRKDGSFSATISLDAGREYRFRYLVDGERWENDDAPDQLVYNRFGSQDCVLAL
ncbi:MAG: isoamylase early set domain-containing protein [Acidobacteriota bacterium]